MFFLEKNHKEDHSFCHSLTSVYGLNKHKACFLSKQLGLSKNFIVKNATHILLMKLESLIENQNFKINSSLRHEKKNAKKLLVDTKTYRGIRNLKGLPVRGQRTRSNHKTAKKLSGKVKLIVQW